MLCVFRPAFEVVKKRTDFCVVNSHSNSFKRHPVVCNNSLIGQTGLHLVYILTNYHGIKTRVETLAIFQGIPRIFDQYAG